MAKESVLYFSHDSNARNDNRVLELRAYMSWEGYGLYFAIIEILREQSNYNYPSNAKAGLALCLNISIEKLQELLDICFNNGLLIEKDDHFYSESLMNRMSMIDEKRAKRADAGRKGGKAKAKAKQKPSNAKANPSKKRKEKESKDKVNNNRGKRFSPPTIEQVKDYCSERKNTVDPQRFVDFYETKGWYVGKNKMKSWKAAVRTWEGNNFNKSKNTVPSQYDNIF